MRVLGVNAVFHDPAAAVVVDGVAVAAAEEEPFMRRKHGKQPVAFSTWELPERSMAWCLVEAGLEPGELDAVAYSYDPDLAFQPDGDITAAQWEGPRTLYARRALLCMRTALPGLAQSRARWVPHHLAHAAFAVTAWWLGGLATLRRRLAAPGAPRPATPRPAAVLFDRDGTLVVDVPYNGDPGRVEPLPGAAEALARLRAAGVSTAVVSNQSGIGRGLVTEDQVRAVNARVEALLGPLGPSLVCPHAPDDGCDCRKPAPGLILRAAERLGVAPERCVVVGDIGADVAAARAAGARPILVPTAITRPEEIAAAPEVATDLSAAVERALGVGA